ncbi:hypothetical protein THAOC_01012, partial [Thalassiosira oceanica]
PDGGGGEGGGDDDDDDAAAASGDGGGGVQTMEARVETRYRQESYTSVMEGGEEPESEPMSTILEAMVTTLDRPALTVVDADSFAFGEDHVMVSVRVQCNSPVPFYIKEWHLDLPRPLAVEDDGDLNRDMYRHAIPEGEVLLFGFRCTRVDGGDAGGNDGHERPILRVVLQDDFGKTFLQVLPVDLGSMYKKLRKEDAYSEMYQAVADLTCSAAEGTVGHPVPFSYRLDLRSLVTPRREEEGHERLGVADVPRGPADTVHHLLGGVGLDREREGPGPRRALREDGVDDARVPRHPDQVGDTEALPRALPRGPAGGEREGPGEGRQGRRRRAAAPDNGPVQEPRGVQVARLHDVAVPRGTGDAGGVLIAFSSL